MIEAISVTPAAQKWIRETKNARVLLAFAPACYLSDSNGNLLSISIPKIGNGPFNLLIPETIFDDTITTTSQVRTHENQLLIGSMEISTGRSDVWNPMPDWTKLTSHKNRLSAAADLIEDLLIKDAPSDSFSRISENIPNTNIISREMYMAALKGINGLTHALNTLDMLKIGKHSEQLAGLGGGLTPAGDDFLMGIMHAVWALLPDKLAEELSHRIADVAAPRTTSLSAAWLQAAARGEAGERWHELFEAIPNGNSDNVLSAARRILATGHSSGADALGGFILSIRNFAR